jgi:hypothetical protein
VTGAVTGGAITGMANCPNPPLLLPGMTGQPVAEVEVLRGACLEAIGDLLATEPDAVLVVGARRDYDSEIPLSVAVGLSLLAQAGCVLPIDELVMPWDLEPKACAGLGQALVTQELVSQDLTAGARRLGLLVMADGSARRTLKAPGYYDARAAPFDAIVEAALRDGDSGALAGLDHQLAAELLVSGRAAWQVLAGAVSEADQSSLRSRVHYSADPFGVWYPVVSWALADGR